MLREAIVTLLFVAISWLVYRTGTRRRPQKGMRLLGGAAIYYGGLALLAALLAGGCILLLHLVRAIVDPPC